MRAYFQENCKTRTHCSLQSVLTFFKILEENEEQGRQVCVEEASRFFIQYRCDHSSVEL